MTPDEYAATIRYTVEAADTLKPRALLTDTGHIGMSSLMCREQVRRTLIQETPSDSPPRWKAIIGTALDREFKAALQPAFPSWVFDLDVTAELPSGIKISGTLDWADPDEPSVTDLKSVDGLALPRRHWGDRDAARRQRHLLALGLIQTHGWPKDLTVRNIAVDRSGKDAEHFVYQEPFDMAVIHETDQWLQDVYYAIDHGELAMQDVEGHVCTYCPFFTSCRGTDVVTGPITNEGLAERLNLYGDKIMEAKDATAVAEALRPHALNVTGFTDKYDFRCTKVNKGNGSQRITVTPR